MCNLELRHNTENQLFNNEKPTKYFKYPENNKYEIKVGIELVLLLKANFGIQNPLRGIQQTQYFFRAALIILY